MHTQLRKRSLYACVRSAVRRAQHVRDARRRTRMFQGVDPSGSRLQKALPSTSLPYSTKVSPSSALARQYSACTGRYRENENQFATGETVKTHDHDVLMV